MTKLQTPGASGVTDEMSIRWAQVSESKRSLHSCHLGKIPSADRGTKVSGVVCFIKKCSAFLKIQFKKETKRKKGKRNEMYYKSFSHGSVENEQTLLLSVDFYVTR